MEYLIWQIVTPQRNVDENVGGKLGAPAAVQTCNLFEPWFSLTHFKVESNNHQPSSSVDIFSSLGLWVLRYVGGTNITTTMALYPCSLGSKWRRGSIGSLNADKMAPLCGQKGSFGAPHFHDTSQGSPGEKAGTGRANSRQSDNLDPKGLPTHERARKGWSSSTT